jgi:DNA gyrase subunit A
MLITDGGIIIRTRISEIPVYGRSASGVIVMRLEEGSTVARFAVVDPETESEKETEEAPVETENTAEAVETVGEEQ